MFPMRRFLFLDTVSDAPACVLAKHDGAEWAVRIEGISGDGHQAEAVLPMVSGLTGGEPVEMIVVVTGPGRFTSSRIGVTVANALAMSWAAPVVGLDRLELALLTAAGATSVAVAGERRNCYAARRAHDTAWEALQDVAEGASLPDGSVAVSGQDILHALQSETERMIKAFVARSQGLPKGTVAVPFYARLPNVTQRKKL